MTARQRIQLAITDDYFLSIIQGEGAYSGEYTVEAMLVAHDARDHDEVHEGWLTGDALIKLIRKAQKLAKEETR